MKTEKGTAIISDEENKVNIQDPKSGYDNTK